MPQLRHIQFTLCMDEKLADSAYCDLSRLMQPDDLLRSWSILTKRLNIHVGKTLYLLKTEPCTPYSVRLGLDFIDPHVSEEQYQNSTAIYRFHGCTLLFKGQASSGPYSYAGLELELVQFVPPATLADYVESVPLDQVDLRHFALAY